MLPITIYWNETQLPERAKIFNKLNNKDTTDENYNHAKKVWKKFNIKTLGKL